MFYRYITPTTTTTTATATTATTATATTATTATATTSIRSTPSGRRTLPGPSKDLFLWTLCLLLLHGLIQPALSSSETICAQSTSTVVDSVQVYLADFTRHELRITMEANASHVLTEINRAWNRQETPQHTNTSITETGSSELQTMWETAAFYIPDEVIIQTIVQQTDGYYEMRNLPLYFLTESGEEIYEEGVLRFTPSGMIDEVRIGLPMHQYQSLIQQSKDEVDGENREMILSFVEAFRTAYNTKNLDFINNVFSDEALIIVGRVVESTGEQSAFEQQVEYLQFNKDEYIARLRTIFDANTWIDVGFEEIKIDRHPRLEAIYGVYLTQYYTSSIYSDTGYLFLMIDFRSPEEPMIHVRTWEPKNSVPEGERFEMGLIELF